MKCLCKFVLYKVRILLMYLHYACFVSALDFLICTGSLIKINDRKYGVGRLYFPDPSWLCDVLTTVTNLKLTDLDPETRKISRDNLKVLCHTSRFGVEFGENFKEYEQLLKSFEIIMPSADDNTT